MSTQSYYTPTEQVPVHQDPRRDRGPSWFRIVSLVIGAVIAVALVALAVVLSHSHSTAAPATNSAPTTSTSVPANPATPTTPATCPATPVTCPATPYLAWPPRQPARHSVPALLPR